MPEKIKTALRRLIENEAELMGLLFGILTFAVIMAGIFASPHLGTVDSGKYEKIMINAGLSYTQEQKEEGDLFNVRVIENYDYSHFSCSKLFAPNGSGSIVYPISFIRLLTRPFGLGFSTIYLYILYALLTALAVRVIVKSSAYLCGRFAVIPGFMLVMLFADRNLTAYFGSLYEVGTLVVALTVFTACVLSGFTYRKGAGIGVLLPVALSSVFLLNAASRAVVFVPMAVMAFIGLFIREWSSIRRKRIPIGIMIGLVICAVYSSGSYFNKDYENYVNESVYHSIFMGILPASNDPGRDLAELGLDESYIPDIGKSYYLSADEYAHDPTVVSEVGVLFGTVTSKKVLLWHLRHPVKSLRTVLYCVNNMDRLETGWTLGVGEDAREPDKVSRSNSLIGLLGKVFLPKGYGFLLITALFALLAAAGLWIFRAVKRKDIKHGWIEPAVLICAVISVALYLPLHVFMMGASLLEFDRVVSVFCLFALWSGLLMAIGRAAVTGSVWFRKIYEEPEPVYEDEPAYNDARVRHIHWEFGSKVIAAAKKVALKIAGSRRGTVLAISALALVMVCSVQFATPRAGMVNNGDYERMMAQLGLTWTSDIYFDYSAQYEGGVIENYEYLHDFDFSTLTSLKPTYSLVYPVAIVRGICALFGLRFSTWYVALLMSAVLALCIISIVRDLYKYFKKYTILLGIGFCLIFLCESSLVWFNSMFGEGCILLGVMMVLACSVHLSVLPRGKGALWVLPLAFSSMFLTTAKAQMMVALPILLLLMIIFALYHSPIRIGRLVTFIVVCLICLALVGYKGIKIYSNNDSDLGQYTTWQSVFYGALMISDDPEGDMKELGIPLEMAPNIGKHAYLSAEEYTYAIPGSQEAYEAVFNHVNTFTMVAYYLKRPLKLLYMLNSSARQSQDVYNGFRVYLGQNYSGVYDVVDRWGVWLYWRPLFAFAHFWKYVLFYGALVLYAVYQLRRKELDAGKKLLIATFLGIMLIGSFQFPLTAIGNGFADNHKQLYGFMICHDILLLLGMPVLIMKLQGLKKDDVLNALGRVRELKRYIKMPKRHKADATVIDTGADL